MEIKQKETDKKGSFYIGDSNAPDAEMTYVWAGTDRIIIDHTEVGENLKGKNAGKQMLSKAVEFAREKGIKIIPLCPFARSVFNKEEQYKDVL